MPQVSYLARLSPEEQLVVVNKWNYVHDTMESHRYHPMLQNFNRRMSEELGVSESTISQVITGRNKNPHIINYLYDYMSSIFGGDSTLDARSAIRRTLTVNSADKHADLRAKAHEARIKEEKTIHKLMEVQAAAKEALAEYASAQKLWQVVDAMIPSQGTQGFYDIAFDEPLNELVGGGIGLNRLILDTADKGVLDGVAQIRVRRRTDEDYEEEQRRAREAYAEFARN